MTWATGIGFRILPFENWIAYPPIQSKQEYEKQITHIIILCLSPKWQSTYSIYVTGTGIIGATFAENYNLKILVFFYFVGIKLLEQLVELFEYYY